MTFDLRNKVAIITGGAVGVGEAVAFEFAKRGAKIVVVGLPGDPVPEVAAAINSVDGFAESFIGDVAVESQAEECVAFAIETYGQIDILVNTAAMSPSLTELEHVRVSEFDRMLYANLRSVFLMTRFSLPYLKKSQGNIISCGIDTSHLGLALSPLHGSTLAWIHAFMKGVALEVAPYKVRCNTVAPGPVLTETAKLLSDLDPVIETKIMEAIPLHRRGSPLEIASVFAFLASPEASYVTGSFYAVDGGLTIGRVSVFPSHFQRHRERESSSAYTDEETLLSP